MKIIFAADGSACTKTALAYLVAHPNLSGPGHELLVLNVQPPLPARASPWVAAEVVRDYHREEADKVLGPVKQTLDGQAIRYRSEWVVGHAAAEIAEAARREAADLIVMGTHGHGMLGRVVLGSVAQRVLAESAVPVLLVK